MRAVGVSLGVVGAVLVVVVLVIAAVGEVRGDPLTVLGYLFADSPPISKVVHLLLGAAIIVIAITGVFGLARRDSGRSDALLVMGYVCPLVAAVAGAFAGFNILSAVSQIGDVSFPVIAPSVAQAVLITAAGLLVGAVSIGLNEILARRASNAA